MTDRDLLTHALRIQDAREWSYRRTARLLGVTRNTWTALATERSDRRLCRKTRGKLVAFIRKYDAV